MNKQRYLAELQRLLVFMTEEDREEAVRRFAGLFDAAGPEGEAELAARLGSPTKAAISLSRGYEPGKLPETIPGETPKKRAALTDTEDDPWGDLPTFDLPEYPAYEDPSPEGDDEDPARTAEPFSMPDLPTKRPPSEPEERFVTERSMPLGLGIPLFIIVAVGIGIPLAAICAAVMLALLAPGCALVYAAWLTGIGGLWCIAYMADAILLFGAAFIVLSFGLILLFGGLWLDVKLAKLYIRGLRWVAGETLGRKVTADD